MAETDKRKYARFHIGVPAVIAVPTSSEEQEEAITLRTKDVSAGGAYFTTDRPLPAGTEIKIELQLPIEKLRELIDLKMDHVRIKVNGTVHRADQSGFAVRFDEKYDFL